MGSIYYTKFKRRQSRKFPIALLFFDLLIIIFFFGKDLIKPANESVLGKEDVAQIEDISPYPTLLPPSPTPISFIDPSIPLEHTVQNALVGSHGSYGIVIKNLKTNEYYLLNEHLSYSSASLYKLWVMAETYRQIKEGILKENETLSSKYEILNAKFDISPETEKFTKGSIALSVEDALNKMITISDNYAALLLTLRIKLSNIASFLKVNGFNESTVGANGNFPITTASDIALFFEKLYNKQLINEQYSDKMLELLKAQKLNDKIPKYLPGVLIAHKTGELDNYTHDGGIVYADNGNYIMIILSKSDNPDLAKNRISNISESIYEYFTNGQQYQAPVSP
jgi:beta-lactamase class A